MRTQDFKKHKILAIKNGIFIVKQNNSYCIPGLT